MDIETATDELIEKANFIVVDFETTGLSASLNRVTEIGLVHVRGREIVDEFTTLINPGQFVPSYITELTGITNDMVYDKPPFDEVYPEVKQYLFNNTDFTIFTGHNAAFDYKFLKESVFRATGEQVELPVLCTCRLARRLNKSLLSKSLYSLSRHFKIKVKRRHRALDDAKATAEILIHFLKMLEDDFGIVNISQLLSFQHKKIYEKDKIPANIKRIKEKLKAIPHSPGVYKMFSRNGELLYIGKAKNLHDRVNSYFYHNTSHTSKVRKLIRQVHKVDYELAGSELSALILESALIKKHKPHFNSAIKRYKRFPFLKIDIKNRYPRLEKTFEIKLDGAKYYGPFRSNYTADSLLEKVDTSFSLRKCRDKNLAAEKTRSSCMYYEMKQCKAPCNLTQSHDDYKKEVKKVVKFLETQASPGALKTLEDKMYRLSEEMNYEEASEVRDRLEDLRKVLLNLELTNSEINLKNFVVKCPNGHAKKSAELFFVASGKLVECIRLPETEESVNELKENIKETIENIYFRGNLFSSVLYNSSGKFTREELDKMKIISNWIYLNNSAETLLKIDEKTRTNYILDFVIGTAGAAAL